MTTGKTIILTIWIFVGKVLSLFFKTHCHRFVIAFIPRSKHPLISWLQSPSAVILEPPPPQENKVCYFFHFFLFHLPWSDGTRCYDLSFIYVEFQGRFFTLLSTLIKGLFSSPSFSAIRIISSVHLRLLIFLPAILIPAVIHPSQHFT